ncbi:mitochondrial amidoxime reducing component 2-like [Rhynchophorus ferrugineus]|uniref:mitochondrial amidoxime reducing component 2-like n=1 Tax=Rhynchophorus ferrugineus TaxID=354439 RepID=UPI003FCC8336
MASLNQTHVTAVAGALLVALVTTLLFKRVRKEKIPTKWTEVGSVRGIYIYPLKSGKGQQTSKVLCTSKGLKEIDKGDGCTPLADRCFLIYTSKDRQVRTARQLPKIVLIEVQPAQNGVIFSAPSMTDLYINLPRVANNVTAVSVWGKTFGDESFACTDCGDTIAKWLSTYLLGKPEGLRLGYGDGSAFRNILRNHANWVKYYTKLDNYSSGIFSDLAPLHLINQTSLDDLNQKLPDDRKITERNFRPNILINGPEAFAEDKWQYLKIGEVTAKVTLECLRCVETTVTDEGALDSNREPLKTLSSYRKSEGPFKSPPMGIYLKVLVPGRITDGDKILVSK